MKQPGNWWPCFGPAITDEEARTKAAKKLNVPEKHIGILRTGGAVLARERQEEVNG